MAIDNLPMFTAMNREEVKPPFPPPCKPPMTSQEAHFAIMEKVNACINEVNNFEQRVRFEMEKFMSAANTENTGFKEAIQASYNTFMQTVQHEVNNFEIEMQNNFDLYRNGVDKRFADFQIAIEKNFTTLQTNVLEASNGKIQEMEELKISLNQTFTEYRATLSEIVANFKTQVNQHMNEQDRKIEEYKQFMVDNLSETVEEVFNEKAENGEISAIMSAVYGGTRTFKGSLSYDEIQAVTNPANGDYYYCTSDGHYYQRTETAWVDIGNGDRLNDDYEAFKVNTAENFAKVRGTASLIEGELIIDRENNTVCGDTLLIITSDREFAFVKNAENPVPFDTVRASVLSIFIVCEGNRFSGTAPTYTLRIGTAEDMNKYENVYYVGGLYNKKLVGNNFCDNLNVTINGETCKAREIIYNSPYNSDLAKFNNLSARLNRERVMGYLGEGELIIDRQNQTISGNGLLLLTSDQCFTYVNNADSPVPYTLPEGFEDSLYTIYAVCLGNPRINAALSYELHIGKITDMDEYENPIYICGFYKGQIVGANVADEVTVTVNGVSQPCYKVRYASSYSAERSELDEAITNANNAIERNYSRMIEGLYENSGDLEISGEQLTLVNASKTATGVVAPYENLTRVALAEILPSYDSDMVEVVLNGNTKYSAILYCYEANKEFVQATHHTATYEGKYLRIPLDTPYFSLMIAHHDSSEISPSEVEKIILYRKVSAMKETTLDMIPEMLLSDNTTHIKLLGDSITQGVGSTGYIGYNTTENGTPISVRGNGPDYPNADSTYEVGDFLGENGSRRWYEAVSATGWANQLKQYFESKFNCSVKNYGMSGIGSSNLSTLCKPLVSEEDDIVILMIGTNDRSGNYETFISNVKNFVRYVKGLNKHVVLMGCIPSSISDETANRNFHMEDVSTALCSIANDYKVAFISVYDKFVEYCENKGVSIDSLLSDGLHPNDEGYKVMFNIISKSLGVSVKRDGATW